MLKSSTVGFGTWSLGVVGRIRDDGLGALGVKAVTQVANEAINHALILNFIVELWNNANEPIYIHGISQKSKKFIVYLNLTLRCVVSR